MALKPFSTQLLADFTTFSAALIVYWLQRGADRLLARRAARRRAALPTLAAGPARRARRRGHAAGRLGGDAPGASWSRRRSVLV